LWGSDGSNSKVRREIERITNTPSKTIKFGSGYMEFEILPNKDGTFFYLFLFFLFVFYYII